MYIYNKVCIYICIVCIYIMYMYNVSIIYYIYNV